MWLINKLAVVRDKLGLDFKSRGMVVAALLVTIVVIFAILGQFTKTTIDPTTIRNNLAQLGVWGPIALIVALAGVLVIPIIPASLFQIGAGLAFGPLLGLICVIMSDLLGASTGFWLTRWWGRSMLDRFISTENESKITDLSQRLSWRGVILLRLVPGPVYPLVSFAAGYSPMGYVRFISASILGVLPGLVLLVLAGDIGEYSPLLAIALVVLLLVAMAIVGHFTNSKR